MLQRKFIYLRILEKYDINIRNINYKRNINYTIENKKCQYVRMNFCTNTRYRKIIIIPYKKDEKLEYKNIPFDINDLEKKNKVEILNIYKIIRDKNELKKLPNDFIDNLFECTKKYVRSLLPYDFVRIIKTLNVIKSNDKELKLLLNQQMRRIANNFDINAISKLFQIYTFSKSKPLKLIKIFSNVFLNNLNDAKPWQIREFISIFCYFKLYLNEQYEKNYIDFIYKNCVQIICKNIKDYSTKDLTIILYSYVKLNKHNNILLNAVSNNVIGKIKYYNFSELSIIINSYAKIGERNNKMCKEICNKVKKKMKQLRNENNFNDIEDKTKTNGYLNNLKNNIDIHNNNNNNNNNIKNLNNELKYNISIIQNVETEEKEVTDISCVEYKKTKETKSNEIHTEDDLLLKSQILKPKSISLILNALVKLEYHDHEVFNCLIPYIINCVNNFSPQSLSNIVHAYSKMQINNTLLLDKIIKVSIMKIHKFKNKEMSNLANSLVRLNRKDKLLFTYIIDEFLYRSTIGRDFLNYEFDILTLQQFAYSFSKIGLKDNKVYIILYKELLHKINKLHKQKKKEKENIHYQENKNNTVQLIKKKENDNSLLISTKKEMKNEFDFFSLAIFIHSYGKVKIQHKNFSHFISYIIRKKKKNNEVLTNHSLTLLLYGLMKLNIKDKKIYQILLKEAKEKIDYLLPKQIIILLYTFSKLKLYNYRFIKKSIQNLSIHINYLNISDISLISYALSSFLYRDSIFLYKLNKIILFNKFEFNCKNVSQIFNSFTKLCYYHQPIYDFIFQKIIYFIHQFSEQELSNITFSFIYYFHMKKIYLESLQNQNKQEYVSFSKKNNKNEIKKYQINYINENIIHDNSFSNINSNNINLNYINENIIHDNSFANINSNDKINVNNNINSNNINLNNHRKNFKQKNINNLNSISYEEIFKNELNIFFNLIYVIDKKYRNNISLISIYQLKIVDLYLKTVFNYNKLPLFLKIFLFKCTNYKLKINDFLFFSSKTHRNISKYLKLVGINHKSEVQFGPYQLDIVVDFLKNKNIYKNEKNQNEIILINNKNINNFNVIEKLLNKNILIEVDGISHFYKESFSRTLSSIIKDFILKKIGWIIIHIPYQEWNQCYNFKKKLLYCYNIWKYILKIINENIDVKECINIVNINKKEIHYENNDETFEKQALDIDNNINNIPEFYKISEESIFLNEINNENKKCFKKKLEKKF